jgi:hypothetical protein
LASSPFGVIPLAESSRLGGYCVFAMGGMCTCIFARAGVRVFDARTPAPHHLFFCIGYWIASPMERGVSFISFHYYRTLCVSVTTLRSARGVLLFSGVSVTLGETRLCFRTILFYVTLHTSFDHLGWCSPSFYRSEDVALQSCKLYEYSLITCANISAS